MKQTILLVDDEVDMITFMRDALEDEGYEVMTALHAEQAFLMISEKLPDLIVLDVMMPGTDGFSFCKQMRDRVDGPILFVSAKQSEADRIYGLAVGGDDYLVKPFSLQELKARIAAHLRREQRLFNRKNLGIIRFGPFTLDIQGHELRCNEILIPLTLREFSIVELLALHPGQVFAREHIYQKVWGIDASGDDSTVTEHIKNIRAKMFTADPAYRFIETIWGVGYKWGTGR
ncbi:response regulator transcription factor [Brevibacillus laterosporus]|uniref:response regulator transcription factor n=1 Tax=Brevibacillus laterosporus TaxID=1465 RepID=UPI000BD3D6F0|nr:response regulator transcription factor [Brevibacillus laterosporus]AYK07461.1 DNA-binding response regulator [Brevibacillus laterosporus]PCN44038.1 DNA-binding response regulator [Brevibacillus laterosporus]